MFGSAGVMVEFRVHKSGEGDVTLPAFRGNEDIINNGKTIFPVK